MGKSLRVGLLGTYANYEDSFVFLSLKYFSKRPVQVVDSLYCDLLIVGPFAERKLRRAQKRYGFWQDHPVLSRMLSRYRPLVLLHVAENLRPDFFPADYIISSDFCEPGGNQIRFPYWMEMLDWRELGLDVGATNPRYGSLLSIRRLMQPLGDDYKRRPQRAAIFSSHMREPRRSLMRALSQVVPVDGFGPAFDANIQSHNSSGLEKSEILKNYAFNLCPENALYPGYYTEKIPEAFHSGCVPIAWCDSLVVADFNTASFLNLNGRQLFVNPDMDATLSQLSDALCSVSEQPLLLAPPDCQPFVEFLQSNVIQV